MGPPVPLEFVHAGDRYVRFFYQGASPRTYSTSDLLKARRLHVPDVLPGGELLLHVPPMTVRPVQLLVGGPRARVIALDSAIHASLAGIPPGEYRVTPVYEGGLRGAVKTASVRTAETTLAYFFPEDVGAARIMAASDVCENATEVAVDAFGLPKTDPKFKGLPGRVRILTARQPRCEMTFGGLPPGQLEVFYRREGASARARLFEVSPQTVTAVDISSAPVTIEGRVTLNGKPLAETAVTFLPRQVQGGRAQGSPADAKTDALGYYRVSLEAPGSYTSTVLRQRAHIIQSQQFTLVEGRNFHDIVLAGGRITIELTGWPQGAIVRVKLQSASQGSGLNMLTMLRAGKPTSIEGLPFGEYKVSLMPGRAVTDQRANKSTVPPDAKTVILSPGSPEAPVIFDRRR